MININSLNISADMLTLIASIDEFKGSWKAMATIAPEQLTQLKKVATIESIGSSTRIEGSKLSDSEVNLLLADLQIQNFENRDAQEVGGYAAVMNIIFQHFEDIPLTESYIKQLHSILLQYSEKDNWHRGNYKTSPNHVVAFDIDGKNMGIVFETATPFETPLRMEQLFSWVTAAIKEKQLHPLIVTAVFIVELLAIHPFQDGNGRLSRVLTTCMLLKAGYTFVPYSSLEAVIEQNKQGYYLSLRQTQATLKNEVPDWETWVIFFLKAMHKQVQNLQAKIDNEIVLLANLPQLSKTIVELVQSRGRITIGEVEAISKANRNTIKKQLEKLVATQMITKNGTGKGTWYSVRKK